MKNRTFWFIVVIVALVIGFVVQCSQKNNAIREKAALATRDSLVIDSMGTQLGWHETTWDNFTDTVKNN